MELLTEKRLIKSQVQTIPVWKNKELIYIPKSKLVDPIVREELDKVKHKVLTKDRDWHIIIDGEELGKVSNIPHETRNVQMKEEVKIKHKGKELLLKIVDTPGIATKIDYEEFIKYGLNKKIAKKRAKEATQGIIEAIQWLP